MRLIDADALIEFIDNRYKITWKDDYEGGIKDACTDILEKISKMPTIEPERKKGKWISKGCGEYRCSSCRNIVDLDEEILMSIKRFNYCPVCGADNREDQDGKSN